MRDLKTFLEAIGAVLLLSIDWDRTLDNLLK